jgi:diguanylate cyclase (GGDEF)-like protein
VPLNSDPFSFLLARDQPFYATDFPRLLWSLPWYRGEVKVGSLVAVPVRVAGTTVGALVADRLEVQAFTGHEPKLLAGFAELAAEAIRSARAALGREELEAEFKAVYPISQRLATLSREKDLAEELLKLARQISGVEGAAVVTRDEHDTRYTVFAGFGWAADYVDREVGLDERTWAAWVLRSAEEACLLDELAGRKDSMPVLVLDEAARAGSLLVVPLRARDRNLAALVLTGAARAFDVSSRRVLELLANQAGATLCLIQERELQRRIAAHDGLTGLYNRRAFNELLVSAIGAEDRREAGHMGLVILDLDHFKKLNAALRSLGRLLLQHLRKSDLAARYGGEEFAVILPASDEARACQAAERLRAALQKHRFIHSGTRIPLSASLGVAIWPEHGREPDALLAAADRALYEAKQTGRNRVVLASVEQAPAGDAAS